MDEHGLPGARLVGDTEKAADILGKADHAIPRTDRNGDLSPEEGPPSGTTRRPSSAVATFE
ncbi:hypothetical protein GCM10009735_32790 [Actinomadura chokoriensis]